MQKAERGNKQKDKEKQTDRLDLLNRRRSKCMQSDCPRNTKYSFIPVVLFKAV
jgi:hypothetical protein